MDQQHRHVHLREQIYRRREGAHPPENPLLLPTHRRVLRPKFLRGLRFARKTLDHVHPLHALHQGQDHAVEERTVPQILRMHQPRENHARRPQHRQRRQTRQRQPRVDHHHVGHVNAERDHRHQRGQRKENPPPAHERKFGVVGNEAKEQNLFLFERAIRSGQIGMVVGRVHFTHMAIIRRVSV